MANHSDEGHLVFGDLPFEEWQKAVRPYTLAAIAKAEKAEAKIVHKTGHHFKTAETLRRAKNIITCSTAAAAQAKPASKRCRKKAPAEECAYTEL